MRNKALPHPRLQFANNDTLHHCQNWSFEVTNNNTFFAHLEPHLHIVSFVKDQYGIAPRDALHTHSRAGIYQIVVLRGAANASSRIQGSSAAQLKWRHTGAFQDAIIGEGWCRSQA